MTEQNPEISLRPRSVLTSSGWHWSKLAFWLSVGALSAAVSFGLHHLPYFAEHELIGSIVAVVIASSTAVLAVGLAANRRHAHPPVVVVAGPEQQQVSPAVPEDIEFCASLHALALSHGFFVSLGPLFMRAYYETFLSSPHAVALVAKVKGHPVGMVVGVTDPAAHARWAVRRRGLVLAGIGAGAMLTRPVPTARFIRTRLCAYRRAWRDNRAAGETDEQPTTRRAVLTHIAVLPGARGAGIGDKLAHQFLDEARGAGCGQAALTTLTGERGARDFYLTRGWREEGTRIGADSQASLYMALELDGCDPTGAA